MNSSCLNVEIRRVDTLNINIGVINDLPSLSVSYIKEDLNVLITPLNTPLILQVSAKNNLDSFLIDVGKHLKGEASQLCGLSYNYSGLVFLQDKLLVFSDGKKLNVKKSEKS